MRFLILDSYYQEFLNLAYGRDHNLANREYSKQLEAIYDLGFARADSLQKNLRLLGHEADQVIVNADILQKRWAFEHRLKIPNIYSERWDLKIISAQVGYYKPDIILNCDLNHFPSGFLKEIKGTKRVLVGECAYPLRDNVDLNCYDLIVSAAPHFVDRFRSQGANAEHLRLGFEASILGKLKFEGNKSDEVVFVGSISAGHQDRIKLLEKVSQRMPLQVYGEVSKNISIHPALKKRIYPAIWGYDMYRRLSLSRVVLNSHIDAAGEDGGNMRMYETTGVGAFLLTDWKNNLSGCFEVGKEIAAYHDPEECIELIKYYLAHEEERKAIAQAGQARTLREHTYYQRMQELIDIVRKYI